MPASPHSWIRDAGLWTLYFPLRWVVGALPADAARGMGRATGTLHALASAAAGGGRLRRNMETLLGREAARRSAATYLRRKHQTLFEHFLISRRGPAAVGRLLGEIRGREHLDRARKETGGGVLALFHFGNIRMLAALGYEGYPLVQLLNRTTAHEGRGNSASMARRVRDLKVRMDRAMPARFLHWQPGLPARQVYRVPREGAFLLVHLDGSRGSSFHPFDFLGGRAPFATGAARIASRTDVPLIPVFCLGREDGRHDVIVEPPVPVAGGPETMTARCVRLLERYVRSHPEQWWTWARLETEVGDDGRIRLEPRPAVKPEEAGTPVGAAL